MFNNIIYFILALFLINMSYPDTTQEYSLSYFILMLFLSWLIFSATCRRGFRRLMYRFSEATMEDGRLTAEYHKMIFKLSIFAVLLFAIAVFMFHLKYWIQIIPGIQYFSVLQGMLALMLFLFYLGTIWFFAYPVYIRAFHGNLTQKSFLISNFKFNMPILFPYLILSSVYDLMSISPWALFDKLLSSPAGQFVFFTVFLIILMIFMPRLIQYWWGCRPFEGSERIGELKGFLSEMGFRYRDLLRWPIFEGRVMTAGIMGIVPRYRYILVTESLMKILSTDELKAVLAHEMGHAKYRHLFFYVLFLIGYMVLSFGLFDPEFYFVAGAYVFGTFGSSSSNPNIFYVILTIPILVTIIVYFRFVMGFFMRHFERQADLHSAVVMGSPRPIVSSLEKIALLSGQSRDHPSWHHFSIKERVDFLWRFMKKPGLMTRHNRVVAGSFGVYLIGIIGLGYILNFSPIKQRISDHLLGGLLTQQLIKEPDNILLNQNLAMIYHKIGRQRDAIKVYEKIILLDRTQAIALNNLAWILVTTDEKGLRDPRRALTLAKDVVALEFSPIFLDTLAEAYYANGLIYEAIQAIKDAMDLATEKRDYYEGQLVKFMTRRENI